MGGQRRRDSFRVAWRMVSARDWACVITGEEIRLREMAVVISAWRLQCRRGEVMMWVKAVRMAEAVVSEPAMLVKAG